MLQFKKLFILFWGLTISTFSFASNPWDGLTNGQLAGNIFNSDSTGYTFNYGNLYPTSNLDPIIMNCVQSKSDMNDVFDGADLAQFSTTEYNDTTIQGKGSIKYSFQDNYREEIVSALFNEGNCGGFGNGFVKITSDSKIRAMVKSSVDVYLTIYALTYSDHDSFILHDKLIFAKDKRISVLLKKDQWTEVEFSIGNMIGDQVVTPSTIHGISYVFSNDIEALYTTSSNFDFYVDWLEVGKNVGQKISLGDNKTEYIQLKEKYTKDQQAQNLLKDSTGYTFNFGTHIGHDSLGYLENNCIDGYLYGKNNPIGHGKHGVYNFLFSQGISTTISSKEFVDTSFQNQGSLNYSFDGTQDSKGYVITKFYKENCFLLNKSRGFITLENPQHRKIRAMVKVTQDAYLRMFAGIDKDYDYESLKFNTVDSLNLFNHPLKLNADEWTEVEFNVQERIDNYPFPVDFNQVLGVTISITNHQDEALATAFPVDLYVDWLEIGSSVGQKKIKTNDVLANNNISDTFLEYNFSNIDTSNYSFEEINCLPKDSISNDLYNITNQQNVKFAIHKNKQANNDTLDGSLEMKFSNISNNWIINKFMIADCQTKTLDLTTLPTIELTVKPSQSINLKVATVIDNENSFYVNDTLNSVSSIELQKDTWQTIQFNIPSIFDSKNVDLTKVIGLAFQVTSSTNQRTMNTSTELLIDQIKIGTKTISAINNFSKKHFIIYPNPTNHKINIDNLPQDTEVIIYNRLGEIVSTSNENVIDISALVTGMYFLQIIQNNQIIHSEKIIKN